MDANTKSMKRIFFGLMMLSILSASAQVKKPVQAVKKPTIAATKSVAPTKSKERLVEITTDYGVMVAKLYDSTPKHRDNFIKLVQEKTYDSTLFHRVITGFMIQGGDPTSKNADSTAQLGGGSLPGDRIPAEFKPNIIHKKGALAAARDGNPAKASSNCQFYIVQGKKTDTMQLRQIEQSVKGSNPAFSYTKQQREIYERIGGTPFLDQNYTVFGEVISGLDVIDKIAALQTRPVDRPIKDVRMKIRLLN
jgi:cyclophilin family peptidyl-prolyl cis-trans isomerase